MALDQKAEPGSHQVWLVVTVTNAGVASAASHTLIIVAPPGVVPVKDKTDHRCDLTHADTGEIRCAGPALAPGASEVYRVLARGAARPGNSGSVSAVVIPAPDQAEAVPSDNVVTQSYLDRSALAASPSIETYFDDPRAVVWGDTIRLNAKVHNGTSGTIADYSFTVEPDPNFVYDPELRVPGCRPVANGGRNCILPDISPNGFFSYRIPVCALVTNRPILSSIIYTNLIDGHGNMVSRDWAFITTFAWPYPRDCSSMSTLPVTGGSKVSTVVLAGSVSLLFGLALVVLARRRNRPVAN